MRWTQALPKTRRSSWLHTLSVRDLGGLPRVAGFGLWATSSVPISLITARMVVMIARIQGLLSRTQ